MTFATNFVKIGQLIQKVLDEGTIHMLISPFKIRKLG